MREVARAMRCGWRTFLPFRSASVRSPTDFLAISTQPERATRDCDILETGATYEVEENASESMAIV